MRVVEFPGRSSCAGFTISDALGAFDWTCDSSTGTVRFISNLKLGKSLSDLIDFNTPGWKQNSVTVSENGNALGVSPATTWWANPVTVDNDGGSLYTAGTIYLVTNDALSAGYAITNNSVGLVVKPGVIVNWPGATGTARVISAQGVNFIWIEGRVDAVNAGYGVFLNSVKFSQFKKVQADNAVYEGIHLASSAFNKFCMTSAGNNNVGIYIISSNNNLFDWYVSANNNSHDGVFLSMSSDNMFRSLTASYNTSSGVDLYSTADRNVFKDVRVINNGGKGIDLNSGNANAFSLVHAVDNADSGVYIYSTSGSNKIENVVASNNGVDGITINGSNGNILSQVMSSNNHSIGVYLYNSRDNSLAEITATNNGIHGLYLGASPRNVFQRVTSVNNAEAGILLNSSGGNTFAEVTANNNLVGVELASSSSNTFSGTMATDNGNIGYFLALSSNNYFTDLLRRGYNGTSSAGNCVISLGTNPGLNNDCSPQGISDFPYNSNIYLVENSFVGKVVTEDASNFSDTNGAASSPASVSSNPLGWTIFDNSYRTWGLDGSAFPSADHRGRWVTGTGRIWDWSKASSGSWLPTGLALPNGNNVLTHTWSDDSTTTFLRRTVEIQSDSIGNDNTLCESGEACLFTWNLGSYQGHGTLVSAGSFTAGTLTGITLKKYETNGR